MQFASIPAGSKSLSAIVHLPVASMGIRGWVLHLPAFADEMNKARTMVHRCASGLSVSGFAVVIPDLTGCGDSPGEFGEVNWDCWREDIEHIIDWMRQSLGAKAITLWGLRLGCLMAGAIAAKRPDDIERLVFWQPVLDGKLFLNQFLRIRVATSLFSEARESINSLQEELASSGRLMVAGYELSQAMYTQLGDMALRNFSPRVTRPVEWFEMFEGETPPPNLQTEKLITHWQDHGLEVNLHPTKGPRFWTTQEIAIAPALLSSTMAALHASSSPVNDSAAGDLRPSSAVREIPVVHLAAGETGIVFECRETRLTGIFHDTRKLAGNGAMPGYGVVLVVGGPQYRVGSHRHFVELSRALAGSGTPVLRFDYRGMGDSDGELPGFERIDDDIEAAVDQLQRMAPSIRGVVLLGLCDAATAVSTYAGSDPRIKGLILLNPWVYSELGKARTMLTGYYLQQITGRQFWRRLLSGDVAIATSLRALVDNFLVGFGLRSREAEKKATPSSSATTTGGGALAERVASGLKKFNGQVLLVLSGRDLTADEFRLAEERSAALASVLRAPTTTRLDLPAADHTFSDRTSKTELESEILAWVQQL